MRGPWEVFCARACALICVPQTDAAQQNGVYIVLVVWLFQQGLMLITPIFLACPLHMVAVMELCCCVLSLPRALTRGVAAVTDSFGSAAL